MKVTAINKCPICGGTVNIQADISVRLVLDEDGNSFFSTEKDERDKKMIVKPCQHCGYNEPILGYMDDMLYCGNCGMRLDESMQPKKADI